MTLAGEIDDRTTAEQLRDLSVDVIRPKKEIIEVRWVKKYKATKSVVPYVAIHRNQVYINTTAFKMLRLESGDDDGGVISGSRMFNFGVGKYEGKRVLLMRKVFCGDGGRNGYKLAISNTRAPQSPYATTSSPGLMAQLKKMGLKIGKYDLVEINGGWMGVPRK